MMWMSDRSSPPPTSADPTPGDPLRSLPKVLLHDHLDGGLRPATVVELAREQGYRDLPTYDVDDLAAWFHRGADQGSLELYLETFLHTVAVLSTPEAIERVAFEAVEDLAADGVVYLETRFAPELVTLAAEGSKMTLDEAITAMWRGLETAPRAVVEARIIVCAMRNLPHGVAAAEAAVRNRDRGVVGFDIAGPEVGWPARNLRDAFAIARDGGLGVTIHAGEADGLDSIADALACGADRLGHGVRIVDDLTVGHDGDQPGPLARMVRDRGIVLEVCPTSNVHTRAAGATAFDLHPIDRLRRAGFAVTVNTDNRLMSDVTVLDEYRNMAAAFGWDAPEFATANRVGLAGAFCDDDTRRRVGALLDAAYGDAPGNG